jgi:hypothetical protein
MDLISDLSLAHLNLFITKGFHGSLKKEGEEGVLLLIKHALFRAIM